jgi:transcriptional regulator GlxA family with amidase domain
MSQFKVAVYLYPQADLLDFSGPTEIYCYPHSLEADNKQPPPFSVTSFAHENSVVSASPALVYQPNMSFADMAAQITDYDILVIPGAHDKTVLDLIASENGKQICALIRKFAAAKPRPETGMRFLQSVCTGCIVLAASGVLAGRKATTHHLSFDTLKKVADEAEGGKSSVEIVRQRYVDSGVTEAGTRIVTAGGVSSGIDATIYIIGQVFGQAKADFVAEMAEFERRDAAWGV